MSRIDYSRWDNIELSDDEDIAVHPNIDKNSFIRMRQRQIHQERDERRHGIDQYGKQLVWLDKYLECLAEFPDPSKETKERLETLMKEFEGIPEIFRYDKFNGTSKDDWETFRERIRTHRKVVETEKTKLEVEASRKLAVDDLCKPGFDSKTRITKFEPAEKKDAPGAAEKEQVETIEVLNPGGVARASEERTKNEAKSLRTEEDTYINNDAAVVFANMSPTDYPKLYEYLNHNKTLISQEIADEILAAAFQLEMNKKPKKAAKYIHQALVLQFCNNLGVNGAPMFFAKINDPSHRATQLFHEDLERTTKHIKTRTKALRDKAEGKRSGVNLEPVGNKMEVFRSLPADLQQALLREDLDDVQKILDAMSESDRTKWWDQCKAAGIIEEPKPTISNEEKVDLFKELPEDFGKALLSGELEKANELLGSYAPEEAERVLDICKRGGFLDIQEEEEEEEGEGAEQDPAEASNVEGQ